MLIKGSELPSIAAVSWGGVFKPLGRLGAELSPAGKDGVVFNPVGKVGAELSPAGKDGALLDGASPVGRGGAAKILAELSSNKLDKKGECRMRDF